MLLCAFPSKPRMNKIVERLISLGVPGLVLLVAVGTSGLAAMP